MGSGISEGYQIIFSYSNAVKQYGVVYKSKCYAFTKCPNLSGRAEEQEVGSSCPPTWNRICEIVLLSLSFNSCSIIFIFQSMTEEEYVKRSKSDMRPLAPMKSATLSQMAENQFLSKASSVLGMV